MGPSQEVEVEVEEAVGEEAVVVEAKAKHRQRTCTNSPRHKATRTAHCSRMAHTGRPSQLDPRHWQALPHTHRNSHMRLAQIDASSKGFLHQPPPRCDGVASRRDAPP